MIIGLKSPAKGEIKIEDNSILFNDKSGRMNKHVFKIAPILFLFFGIYQLYSGIMSDSVVHFSLKIFMGILLMAIPALLYHSNFLRTNRKEIVLDEIKDVKMKSILGEIFIDFNLKDNSTRRVYNIKSKNDWNLLKDFLSERNIHCSN